MNQSYDKTILDHYASQAREHGDDMTSTMADRRTRELETQFIRDAVKKYGSDTMTICDVGCGNGYTLSEIMKIAPNAKMFGIEFTPELRQIAENRFDDEEVCSISPGDVRREFADEEAFDIIICQRVLINLLNIEDQQIALKNIIGSLKTGGVLILIEAFWSGLNLLNEARSEFDLDALPPAFHNLYMDEATILSEKQIKIIEDPEIIGDFLSTHYFVTRVVHPLFLGEKPFVRNSHFVRFFSEALLPNVGCYSPVRGLLLRKVGAE